MHASYPDPDKPGGRKEIVVKLCKSNLIAILRATYRSWYTVSQDKANYDDAPTEGIRRVLEIVEGRSIPRGTTHLGTSSWFRPSFPEALVPS